MGVGVGVADNEGKGGLQLDKEHKSPIPIDKLIMFVGLDPQV